MNQNMKFLICVRSNEDEINEKKLSSSEEIKKSRSEDFFSRAISHFTIPRFFALSGGKNDLSNKFPHVTFPLRFRFAFSCGLFFFLSKNILVPLRGIRASGNTGSAPSWPIRACLRIQAT